MHYRNGREAKNGDMIVKLSFGTPVRVESVGILYDAKPGNNYCNGNIASVLGGPVIGACLCDCVHIEDLGAILEEKGLHKRPDGV